MEEEESDDQYSLSGGEFRFAFNNVNFSDRVLRIEITRGRGEVSCSSFVDWVRARKRRREDVKNHAQYVTTCNMESEFNMGENKHEDTMVMAEQQYSQSGSEDVNKYYKYSALRVIKLHISSAILAAKSLFFFKLLSNGMREPEQKHITLKIDASEEAALMELLYFMYNHSLSVTGVSALLDVLITAKKFEVDSCMKYCSRLLLNMPLTLDSALLILELPPSLLMADSVKPLTNAANKLIASHYKDICKFQVEEVMALPLVGIKAILASDDLQILSEDLLYEVVLRWAKTNYSVLEERQEILGSHLARYIRFPYISCQRLKKILTSDDFKPCVATKLVLKALIFKSESKQSLSPEKRAKLKQQFVERAYKYRAVKIVEFKVPRHQCIVYLDLKRIDCENLYPSSRMNSETFHLGGQGFFLSAHCNMDQIGFFRCFGLFLGMQEKGSVSLVVDYEFSARSKPTEEYVRKFKGNYTFIGGKAVGNKNLFEIPWSNFVAKDCPFFIDDVLHLRAVLSIRL